MLAFFSVLCVCVCVSSASLCFSDHNFVFFLVSQNIASNILCGAGSVDMNSFSLFLSWKNFLSPTMANSFIGQFGLATFFFFALFFCERVCVALNVLELAL